MSVPTSLADFKRIAQHELVNFRFDQLEERVADAFLHVHALHRDAALAGQPHRVACARLRGGREVGVVVDDRRVVAAQFQRDPAKAAGGPDRDAGAARAGEADEIDARIRDQRSADVGTAIDDVEHAGRQAGFDYQLDQTVHDQRGLRRGFQHHRVAGGDRWRDLVGGQIEGRVEGGNGGDHADRKAHEHRELARSHRAAVQRHVTGLDANRLLCRQQHGLERAPDLRLGILDRLAGFARHQLGEPLRIALYERSGAAQQRGALVGWHRSGLRARLDGGGHRRLDVGSGRNRRRTDHLTTIRIADFDAAPRVAPAPADERAGRNRRGSVLRATTAFISRRPDRASSVCRRWAP